MCYLRVYSVAQRKCLVSLTEEERLRGELRYGVCGGGKVSAVEVWCLRWRQGVSGGGMVSGSKFVRAGKTLESTMKDLQETAMNVYILIRLFITFKHLKNSLSCFKIRLNVRYL